MNICYLGGKKLNFELSGGDLFLDQSDFELNDSVKLFSFDGFDFAWIYNNQFPIQDTITTKKVIRLLIIDYDLVKTVGITEILSILEYYDTKYVLVIYGGELDTEYDGLLEFTRLVMLNGHGIPKLLRNGQSILI